MIKNYYKLAELYKKCNMSLESLRTIIDAINIELVKIRTEHEKIRGKDLDYLLSVIAMKKEYNIRPRLLRRLSKKTILNLYEELR